MQKPYCKMTLKDLLDLLNSEKPEAPRPEPEIEIHSIHQLSSVKIDEKQQKNAVHSPISELRGSRN
jgi:hypothetical protein